jgi:hypothetical protein
VAVVSQIEGRWIEIIAPSFFVLDFDERFPPGTNVYANISLSGVNTLFVRNAPDPKFSVEAFIGGWTFFQADGQESSLQGQGVNFTQNAVQVNNCASIRFVLAGERVSAIAQINIFIL